MEQTISIEQRIKEIFANDPLYQVIKETPTEQHFLSEPYLHELIEKNTIPLPKSQAGLMLPMPSCVITSDHLKITCLMTKRQIPQQQP